jgi:hypothetical protein
MNKRGKNKQCSLTGALHDISGVNTMIENGKSVSDVTVPSTLLHA